MASVVDLGAAAVVVAALVVVALVVLTTAFVVTASVVELVVLLGLADDEVREAEEDEGALQLERFFLALERLLREMSACFLTTPPEWTERALTGDEREEAKRVRRATETMERRLVRAMRKRM